MTSLHLFGDIFLDNETCDVGEWIVEAMNISKLNQQLNMNTEEGSTYIMFALIVEQIKRKQQQ